LFGELERFINSPTKNPDTENSLLRQSSPEREIRRFRILEIQTAVRSVIVPEDELLKRIKFLSKPAIGIESFLNFAVNPE